MSIDRDAELPKCFAYNRDGLRCMQIGGHLGKHAHAIEWDDDECFDPSLSPILAAPAPALKAIVNPAMLTQTEPDSGFADETCVACNHKVGSHGIEGDCAVNGCDCKAPIF